MKKVLKFLLLAVIVFTSQSVDAQFLKKLKKKAQEKVTAIEDKVVEKLDTKTDKKIDEAFDEKNQETNASNEVNKAINSNETYGNAILKHSLKYGTVNIDKLDVVKVNRSNNETKIYGAWVTQAADIHDGFVLKIPNSDAILFDKNGEPKKKRFVFKIPKEASLNLSYDPEWKDEADENGFYSAHTKEYQSYDVASGEVAIDVLSKENIQITFSGNTKLVTRTKKLIPTDGEAYDLSYSKSAITGAIDGDNIEFFDSRNLSQTSNKDKKAPQLKPNTEETTTHSSIYQFTFETKVKMTNIDDNETYHISYLLNPKATYMGMKADMGDYSGEEVQGESIIVMDEGNTHVFVEAQGMKMRMSQGMMGEQQMQNPSEQMANYDYTKIKKTGRIKTILGATCYEYTMSDDNVKMELWAAPDVNLPNWFVQNTDVLNGHIMEYTITSKDGNIKSETIAINDNISKTINPKDYRKMF